MTARTAAVAALAMTWLWGAGARADETRACLTASDQAQVLRDQGKLKAAREQMLICGRDVCPEAVRKDCSSWLTAVEASLPSIVISAEDGNKKDLIQVQVSLDGKAFLSSLDGRAQPIDPGPHTLKFEAPGQKALEQTVLIREGEKRRVISVQFAATGGGATGDKDKAAPATPKGGGETPAQVDAPATPTRVPAAAIVFGAVGLVGLGSFVYFGVTGKSDLANLHATCGVTHTCMQGDVDATHNKLLVADLSLAVAVLSLGVGTGVFFAGRKGPASPAPKPPAKAAVVSVGGVPLAKGAGAVVVGSFW